MVATGKSSVEKGIKLYKYYGDKKLESTCFKLDTNGKVKPVWE
jgi:hypothetical protein